MSQATTTEDSPESSSPEFSIGQARRLVGDLFEPRPAIYWADFLLTMTVGFACFRVYQQFPLQWSILAYFGCVLAFYRAGSFIHELVHMRGGEFVGFRIAWNLICGIPFLMPEFTYTTHLSHHVRKHYGTKEDGEYLPLASGPRWKILWYMSQSFIVPLMPIVRFLLLTPLTWISPRLRSLIQQRASSLVMDPMYVRPLPSTDELRAWRIQETCCFLFALGVAVLLFTGKLPWMWLVRVYLMACGVVFLNQLRTLGAHRFRHRGEELTFVQQLLDSVNYPTKPLLAGLWAPVGLRYHALHHLFPSIPYHNLDAAHHRLMAELPEDSPYRRVNSHSLTGTLHELWSSSRESEKRPAEANLSI
jgi:fatty acid desaturase